MQVLKFFVLLFAVCVSVHLTKATENESSLSRSKRSYWRCTHWSQCRADPPCEYGTRFAICWLYTGGHFINIDRCHHDDCNLNMYVWSEWSEFGKCSANCTIGYITRTRECLDNSTTPATVVTNSKCKGPSIDKAICNEMLCSRYSEWSYTPCLSTCEPGIKMETRSCLDNGTVPGDCAFRNLMPCDEEFCSNYSPWVAQECSNMCAPGVTMETRMCLGEGCSPLGCTGRNNVSCNMDICVEYSAWAPVSDCPVTCGGGQILEQRSCLDNGTQVPECLTRLVPCNTQMCPDEEEDVDLLVIFASTNGVDQCVTLPGAVPPFMSTSPAYTQANFPNFFQQSEFLINLLSAWRTTGLDETRVAIQQHSGGCGNQFQSLDIASLNQPFNTTMLEGLTYHCGTSNLATIFGCAPGLHFTAARGDRPDKRNVMLFLFGDVENIASRDILATVFPMVFTSIFEPRDILLLTMSTLNLNSLTPEQNMDNVEYLKQVGCLSAVPDPDCPNYVGNVYDNPIDVKMRIRNVLNLTI